MKTGTKETTVRERERERATKNAAVFHSVSVKNQQLKVIPHPHPPTHTFFFLNDWVLLPFFSKQWRHKQGWQVLQKYPIIYVMSQTISALHLWRANQHGCVLRSHLEPHTHKSASFIWPEKLNEACMWTHISTFSSQIASLGSVSPPLRLCYKWPAWRPQPHLCPVLHKEGLTHWGFATNGQPVAT